METGTCVSAANGQGTLGIGGATGEGTAAKAGYQGMPVTLTVAVKVSQAVPSTVAITFEYFISCGVPFGAEARLRGVQGGPMICPPTAVTALITTPTMVAAVCHWLQAEQMAEQTPSMYEPNCWFNFFCVSVWCLFIVAGMKSGGCVAVSGAVLSSPLLKAFWYCSPGAPLFCFQPVGTLRLKLENLSLASCFIALACGAGIAPPSC